MINGVMVSPKFLALILVCISLFFYAGGEYVTKVWSLKPSWSLAILAIVLYMIGVILWLPALRQHGQISALSTVWSCLSIVVCVAIGVFGFNEELTLRQITGIILALLATLLTL